jgi:hypothetical protein
MAIPDLNDVKDKVDDVKDEAEDKADEAKEKAEEAVEENAPDTPAVPVPPQPSLPTPSTESPRDSSEGGSGDRGSSRGESRSRGRGGSSRGRRSPSPSRSAPSAPVAPASGAVLPTPGQRFDQLAAEAARAKPEDLLGPGVAGPVRNVPRGVLVKRPSAAQTDRLRRRLARAEGCLGNGLQARALGLRAEGRSWAGIGNRLGLSSRRALGLGRLGLARLSTLSGGCGGGGGPVVAGPVAFSQRYGAIGAVAMLGMGSGGSAGAPAGSGGAPTTVAGAPGTPGGSSGGAVLGDSARGGGAVREDGQSSYVGPPPASPGSTLALEPGTSAASGDGNGQGAEIAQALGLLALALVLTLALRYRLRPSPVAAGGASRFRTGSRRRPEREVAEVAVPAGAVAHAGTEDQHDRSAADGEGFDARAYAESSAGSPGHPGVEPDVNNGHGAGQNGHVDAQNGHVDAQNGHVDAGEELAEPSDQYANGGSAAAMPAQPLDAQPLDAQPLDAQPLDAQPLDAQPLDAQPLDAQPSDPYANGDGGSAAEAPPHPLDAEPYYAAPRDAAPPPAPPLHAEPDGSETAIIGKDGAGPSAPPEPAQEAPPPTASTAPAGGQPAWHERPRARRVKRLFSRDS